MLKQKLERMITTLFPDAIPGEDFVIHISDNNEPTFSYWKTEKLGPPHSFDDLHSVYMRFVKARKTADPLIDDSDPMPWLTEAKERALRVRMERGEIPEVVNGTIFRRVR